MPEHINEKHKDLMIWARTSLDKAKWEDKRRYLILTDDLLKECWEVIDQLDPPPEEGVTEVPKVTKLKGAKRGQRK